MILTDLFEKIYLIHVESLEERLSHFKGQISKIGIKFEDIRVINGVLHNNGATVFDRIIGCKMSHLRCLKDAIKHKYKNMLVLEDDVVFHDEINSFLPNIKNFIDNSQWEMFYFGGNLRKRSLQNEKGYNYIFQCNEVLTTHCYSFHNSIYDFVAQIKESRKYPLKYNDDLINVKDIQSRNKTYIHVPRLAYQKTGHSFIRGEDRDYMYLYKD